MTRIRTAEPIHYADGRPACRWRLDAADEGVVLPFGEGPDSCDMLGCREPVLIEEDGTYHLFYDGSGPDGWLACLAVSKDLRHWERLGPVLDRLALLYDTPGGESTSHTKRSIGLAWIDLPIIVPDEA